MQLPSTVSVSTLTSPCCLGLLEGRNWSHLLADACMIDWMNGRINNQLNVHQLPHLEGRNIFLSNHMWQYPPVEGIHRNGHIPLIKHSPCRAMITWRAWLLMSHLKVFVRKILFAPDFIPICKCFEILTVRLLPMQSSINVLGGNYYKPWVSWVLGIQCSLPHRDCSPDEVKKKKKTRPYPQVYFSDFISQSTVFFFLCLFFKFPNQSLIINNVLHGGWFVVYYEHLVLCAKSQILQILLTKHMVI